MRNKLNTMQAIRVILIITFSLLLLVACGKEESDTDFTVDFSFEFIDDNNLQFVNQSEGVYFSLDWDFGNGETVSNSFKTKTYEMYYPEAGNYNTRLTIVDFNGKSETITKELNIVKDDLVVSFTATPDTSNPNKIKLENTSEGEYSTLKWIFGSKEVENKNSTVVYFPYKGTYKIELQLIKDSKVLSKKQEITISNDAPDYIASFVLTWADEFNETEINLNDWTFETGANGWGNNELQNYTNGDNAEVKDGILILSAKKANDNTTVGSYTSTRMITKDKNEFTYGKMEIRAKLPSGRGIWPAIWMLGANINDAGWPACGEIDILEYVGYEPNTVHATVHTPSGSGANGDGSSKTLVTVEEEFHVYGLIWTEKEMIFYIDSPENITHKYSPTTKNVDNWPFYQPQFFILNIAVGGNWGGAQGVDNSIFPQTMEIDYVRIYQPMN